MSESVKVATKAVQAVRCWRAKLGICIVTIRQNGMRAVQDSTAAWASGPCERNTSRGSARARGPCYRKWNGIGLKESGINSEVMESLRWLVDLARRAGAERLAINGSFVTDVLEPNDVDCVLLIGAGFPHDQAAEAELVAGLPFLELSLVNQADFDLLVDEFFATDRHSVGKGMVEIIQ